MKLRFSILPKFSFLSILTVLFLVSACSHVFQQNVPEQKEELVKKEKKVKYLPKVELEFAFAGEAGESVKPEPQISDTAVTPPVAELPEASPKAEKKSKSDSLFEAMMEKARRISRNDQIAVAEPEPMDFEEPEFLDIPVPKPREVPRKTEHEKLSGLPQETPEIVPVSDYSRIVYLLRNGDDPIRIIIGKGKNYWMSTLAGIMFRPGSQGYYKTLDWIVNNNNRFLKRKDLDLVRVGEEINVPVKTTINTILLAHR